MKIKKLTAAVTLSAFLLSSSCLYAADDVPPAVPEIVGTAEEAVAFSLVINGETATPASEPVLYGDQVYLPLRWTLKQLGINGVLWENSPTPTTAAKLTLTLPDYFTRLQYLSCVRGLTISADDLKTALPSQMYDLKLPTYSGTITQNKPPSDTAQPLDLVLQSDGYSDGWVFSDYLMVDNTLYFPLYWFQDFVGAECRSDATAGVITINYTPQFLAAISQLDSALTCETADDCLFLWIRGQQKRSGGLQYLMLTPSLRDKALATAKAGGWTTGSSSPSLGAAEIIKASQEGDAKAVYTVRYDTLLQGESAGQLEQNITIEKLHGAWRITAITGDTSGFTLLPETASR